MDRFTKIVLFILYLIIIIIKDITYSLLRELILLFNLLKIIILNKDKIFSFKL
jgi:hypothetical protein